MSGRVAWISIAPVKALALVNPQEVLLERDGVRENRRFYLIDPDGRMINGKRFGRLVQVVPEVGGDAETLGLRFPDGSVLDGEVALGEPVTTDFFGRPVAGRLVLGPWSEGLSAFTGTPLRLVRAERAGAGTDRGPAGGVSLFSVAALDALAQAAGTDGRVDGRRFRMLFGVGGIGAHEEDSWLGREVRLGDAVVVPRGNVGRCAVTTQNPDSGVRDLDTLGALERYRGALPTTEPLPFGVWGEVVARGRVSVGTPVGLHHDAAARPGRDEA
jgi:MOSC domain-containing protein